MITPNAILDEQRQVLTAPNEGTWDDLDTWDAWTTWVNEPSDELIYLLDPVDLGSVQDFCLNIETLVNGIVDYYIYTSSTGLFSGEETEIEISSDLTEGAAGFSTRYYQVGIVVERVNGPIEVQGISVSLIRSRNTLRLDNVNTSTLSGTVNERTLELPRPIGLITNMQITPRSVTAYIPDFYVSERTTSTHVTPVIVSKTTPSVALVGIDGVARDAVIDVIIEFLPRQLVQGTDLRVI
jgi:hypothetical protein